MAASKVRSNGGNAQVVGPTMFNRAALIFAGWAECGGIHFVPGWRLELAINLLGKRLASYYNQLSAFL